MTDERRDDEIIGRALSRAIDTIDVNQTPYERSRIATAPARRSIFGVWQIAGGIIAIVLAIAIGSWFTRPTDGQPGVAASPTAPAGSSSPSTAPASATPAQDRIWVYFARDGLPPTGGFVTGRFDNSRPDSRIASRIIALRDAKAGLPAGATNAFAAPTPTQSGSSTFGVSVSQIQGDLATVEFELSNGWGVSGSALSLALVQQLVYTISEEPGVRRVLITEKGKPNAVIDQLVIDKPLTRDDVSGYTTTGLNAISSGIFNTSQAPLTSDLASSYSVDTFAPGVTRFVIQDTPTGGAPLPPGWLPTFDAQLTANTDASRPGKATLTVRVAYGRDVKAAAAGGRTVETVDRSPLRSVEASWGPSETIYRLALDDARPWRLFTIQQNPSRIVIDIGGAPRAVSDRIAVYEPRAGNTVSRDVRISGAARVFEANVVWRLLESSGKEVASGHFNASLGTSIVWGSFDTTITIPASVSGNVTLEVFEASAKDGSPQGVVQIPLAVR